VAEFLNPQRSTFNPQPLCFSFSAFQFFSMRRPPTSDLFPLVLSAFQLFSFFLCFAAKKCGLAGGLA
jgi:hypothetical protein